MYLTELNILNFRNIESAQLSLSPKINCLIGQNGMGKTNVLDAIYYLSFCKSSLTPTDSLNINHQAQMAMIQGVYIFPSHLYGSGNLVLSHSYGSESSSGSSSQDSLPQETITCGLRRGQKKQFRRGKTDYKRLIDHIGLIPLVIVSPKDSELVLDGSDERRRFMDSVISQQDRHYLECLTEYNALLKQRNILLKQMQDAADKGIQQDESLLEIYEERLIPHAEYIYHKRQEFVDSFIPVFQEIYDYISEKKEQISLSYTSQLHDRNLSQALQRTRQRDIILGWTSQGIHKDDLIMQLGEFPLKQVGSQGQQKTYIISLKLAQALWLSNQQSELSQPSKPILLLDDIFDKLDSERVARIVQLVDSDRFGQIFITDTDRKHLTDLLQPFSTDAKVFIVNEGKILD